MNVNWTEIRLHNALAATAEAFGPDEAERFEYKVSLCRVNAEAAVRTGDFDRADWWDTEAVERICAQMEAQLEPAVAA